MLLARGHHRNQAERADAATDERQRIEVETTTELQHDATSGREQQPSGHRHVHDDQYCAHPASVVYQVAGDIGKQSLTVVTSPQVTCGRSAPTVCARSVRLEVVVAGVESHAGRFTRERG